MDPNLNNISHVTPHDLAYEISHYEAEIARKDQVIRTLCQEVTGHLNTSSQLQIQIEALMQRIRDITAEKIQLQEQLDVKDADNTHLTLQMEEINLEREAEYQYVQEMKTAFENLQKEHEQIQTQLQNSQVRIQALERALQNRIRAQPPEEVGENEVHSDQASSNMPNSYM